MKKSFGSEQYFEDFTVGDEFEAGPVAFAADEIIAFARQFDPQGFHTDPEFAREHFFGGLIASGWHVVTKTFRALVDAGFLRGGGMGSPGIDELRWKKPVRPGDELRVVLRVTKTRASETRADRGYVDLEFRALNQRDEAVTSYRVVEILRRRPAG
ncbi:MAG: MaoC family dehydratase [Deferrisomatales bacterium]|nr:MaoC family dehydratase [Deferrisomatales bacterium]